MNFIFFKYGALWKEIFSNNKILKKGFSVRDNLHKHKRLFNSSLISFTPTLKIPIKTIWYEYFTPLTFTKITCFFSAYLKQQPTLQQSQKRPGTLPFHSDCLRIKVGIFLITLGVYSGLKDSWFSMFFMRNLLEEKCSIFIPITSLQFWKENRRSWD